MKLSRHLLILTFSLLLIVSVFLCSCGIPTFCSLDNIKVSKTSDKTFTISGADEDINLVKMGPGLIICYVIGDTSINSNQVITEFANTAKTKISIDSNNLVLSTENHSLFAFSIKNDETVSSIKNPLYCLDLSTYISKSNSSLNAKFKIDNLNWNNNEFTCDLIDSSNSQKLTTLYVNTEGIEGNYIYFFVAYSAEVGDFNNSYWSKLVNIGSYSK